MTAFHKIEFRTNKNYPKSNLIKAIKYSEKERKERKEREMKKEREKNECKKKYATDIPNFAFSQLFSMKHCANGISCFLFVIEIGSINLEIW